MKLILFSFLFLTFFNISNNAQTPVQDDNRGYVETMAEYPGGEAAMFKYLRKNIKYPPEAYKNNIGGGVLIEFIIDVDGWVKDVKVIKGIGYGCDEEAVRVVQGMKRWKPGTRNGENVEVSFRLPIKFTPAQKKSKNKN